MSLSFVVLVINIYSHVRSTFWWSFFNYYTNYFILERRSADWRVLGIVWWKVADCKDFRYS